VADLALALRFLLELVGLGTLAWWGWQAGGDVVPLRLGLAVAAPAALGLAWAFVVAPKARNRIPQTTRMVLGTVLLVGVAVIAWAAGQPGFAASFAVLVIADAALVLALRGKG